MQADQDARRFRWGRGIRAGAALVGNERGDQRLKLRRFRLRGGRRAAVGLGARLQAGAGAAPGEAVVAVQVHAELGVGRRRPLRAVRTAVAVGV
ncbi:hypothetical protein RZS08_06650, partial [Arthrospira platensis SPKY1]|nr:hypothetical protein [Arthrospira platensis SPKY1]